MYAHVPDFKREPGVEVAFTFFFRDMNTLSLVEELVFPKLRCRRHLDIWDAGCATGAEPYTVAILLRESLGRFMFRNVRIAATDLNPGFGETLRNATYPEEQVKRIPSEILQRYFSPAQEPGHFVLSDDIRRAVSFTHHDLTSLKPIGGEFGLIVCKNVLLHLNPVERLEVLKLFYDSLSTDGYLATEQTQKLPYEAQRWFEPVKASGSIFRRMPCRDLCPATIREEVN